MKSILNFKRAAAGIMLIAMIASVIAWRTAPAAPASQTASVTTDKDDYAPGETVYITGMGFQPGEAVDLSIAIEDADGTWIPDVDWTIEFADSNGGFEAEYVVPEHWADRTLRLTAMGYSSALVATTTFTDSQPVHKVHNINFATSGLPAGISITITGSRTNPANNVADYSVTFTSPGPSANTGTAPDTTVIYSGFPASVVVSGTTYNLTGTSHASPFTTGAAGSSTTVTGTYVAAGPPPPTNQPPVITCLDPTAELGQAVGCLGVGSGFGKSFPVSYSVVAGDGNSKIVQATFAAPGGDVTVNVAKVTDPDAGDTIAVTLAGGTNPVTISGPGFGSAVFSVDITASDDNGGTDSDTCGGVANAQIIYNFVGFGQPMNATKALIVKRGSGFPVKFRLYDCDGNEVCDDFGVAHVIDVVYLSGAAPNGDPVVTDAGTANSNGVNFRYSGTCGVDGNWIYNLKTNTQYGLGNSYKVIAYLNDGTTIEGVISIRP